MFPWLLIPAGGAVIHGLKKAIDGTKDMKEANAINKTAIATAHQASKDIEAAKEKARVHIEKLGGEKVSVLSNSMDQFISAFEQIKNIEIAEVDGYEDMKRFSANNPEYIQLKKISIEMKDATVNGIAAMGSGALLAAGTYNIVMGGLGGMLVTATTGTALSTLSGAAAANATLAWLGGGAITAGGFGITGGMIVLGGLVVGPALALGGTIFAKQAEKALWEAHTNREKANAYAEQSRVIATNLGLIAKRAYQLNLLLRRLDKIFLDLIADMRSIIRNSGTDWNHYSKFDQMHIYKCVQFAQVIKTILSTSLLNEEGSLMAESKEVYESANAFYLSEANVTASNNNLSDSDFHS